VKHTRASAALLALLLIASAACSRDDEPTATTDPDETTTTEGSTDGDAALLANGGFGDLESVCQEGDAAGATATGVTDTEIHIGTVTDKGGPVSGLNQEMYDTAVAFAAWCNDHGGILGRELVVDDADAKLFEYEAAITTACTEDFALVGGGAVFDEDPNDVRIGCGMPNIAGYVVSERGRTADLQVQPIPNAVDRVAAGRYNAAKAQFPDGIAHYGILSGALPSIQLVRDQLITVAESLDYTVDYQVEFAPTGETGWDNFANEIKSKGIKILEFVGQPGDLVTLTKAFDTAGYHPDVILLSTNFYDSTYAAEGGAIAGNIYIQSAFHPLELSADNKATQDYLDLMEQYNPDGKIALLGTQGLSSWLLFATAATECGSDLTADCLLENAAAQDGWTAGGLHAPMTPGNDDPTPCFLVLNVDADGFHYNEEVTAPTDGDGLYNCDPENVIDVSG
jgi:ABC-type branched-subunit amino acid transport system substrate-binding protein